ncbi:hypothetical protein CNMCM6106_000698 [Aspergillus hiratsukae]|uniref:Uncharacterized protein n=1 Tax=Aspergillus hiratsukae TaxID=1194566 RepID=A0A8H6Q1M2_9EURO|nr:hypothetical protein CNMCM6106_000698 [Aspergillus hiratsukae]
MSDFKFNGRKLDVDLIASIAKLLDTNGIPNVIPSQDFTFVIPDQHIDRAREVLIAANFVSCQDECRLVQPVCNLPPPYAHFILDDKDQPRVVRDDMPPLGTWHSFRLELHKKSRLPWTLPDIPLGAPAPDDPNYMLVTDDRLEEYDPKLDLGRVPYTHYPVKMPTLPRYAESLAYEYLREQSPEAPEGEGNNQQAGFWFGEMAYIGMYSLDAARSVITSLQNIPELHQAKVTIIGGLALQHHAPGSRVLMDVDILIFNRDRAICTLDVRAKLASRFPDDFEAVPAPVYSCLGFADRVKVDFIPQELVSFIESPLDVSSRIARRLINTPIAAIPSGRRANPGGEVDPNHLPFLSLLDTLVYKIDSCSMRPLLGNRIRDAVHAHELVDILSRQGSIPLNDSQEQAVLSGLIGMLKAFFALFIIQWFFFAPLNMSSTVANSMSGNRSFYTAPNSISTIATERPCYGKGTSSKGTQKAPFVFCIVGGMKAENLKGSSGGLTVTVTKNEIEKIEAVYSLNYGFTYTSLRGLMFDHSTPKWPASWAKSGLSRTWASPTE